MSHREVIVELQTRHSLLCHLDAPVLPPHPCISSKKLDHPFPPSWKGMRREFGLFAPLADCVTRRQRGGESFSIWPLFQLESTRLVASCWIGVNERLVADFLYERGLQYNLILILFEITKNEMNFWNFVIGFFYCLLWRMQEYYGFCGFLWKEVEFNDSREFYNWFFLERIVDFIIFGEKRNC